MDDEQLKKLLEQLVNINKNLIELQKQIMRFEANLLQELNLMNKEGEIE